MMTIATLNTWGIPYVKDRPQRMNALAAELATGQYDIIGLQEIWDEKDFDTLRQSAESNGLCYTHHFKSGYVGSGLGVFSRYPIIELDFHRFRLTGTAETFYHGDYMAGKGIGLARIKTPDGILDFYITHLIAQYHPDAFDEYPAHRAAQMFEATRFINTRPDNPAILVGDFNVRPDQLGYRLITTLSGMQDAYGALHPDAAGYTHSNENVYVHEPQSQRIDYIMHRNGITPQSIQLAFEAIPNASIPYSDHYGLIMTCTFHPQPPDRLNDPLTVLQELYEVMQAGIIDGKQRQEYRNTRFQIGILAFLAVNLLPRRVKLILRSITIIYIVTQRALMDYFIRDEVNDMKQVLAEVETLVHSS